MAKAPLAAAWGGTPDDIEARFYEALRRGDIDALMALWADEDDVVCIHAGGQRLVGLAAIRAGFETLFGRGPFAVQPQQVRRVQQIGCALHHLIECIERPAADPGGPAQTACTVATNFYLKTAQGWRLAAHHASAAGPDDVASAAAQAPTASSSTLH